MYNEIDENSVVELLDYIYLVATSKEGKFITIEVKETLMPCLSSSEMRTIMGYLPMLHYKGKPFVMSTTYNIGTKTYKVVVVPIR